MTHAAALTAKRAWVVLVGLLLASPTLAATLHVQPGDSLASALDQVHAGDTLLLHAGVYVQQLDLSEGRYPHLSGTAARRTTIAAAPGETVTLRPGNAGSVLRIAGTQAVPYRYLVFDRLRLDATGGGYGVSMGGETDHIRLQGGAVFGGAMSGISGLGDFSEVVGMQIHHNGGTNRLSHGFYVCPKHALIQGNDIYANGGYGIQVYDPYHAGCSTGLRILGNRIHDNLGDGGVVLGGGEGILFCGNVVHNNRGGGIRPVCYGSPNRRIQIVANTVRGNGGAGLAICSDVTETLVRNNLFADNQGDVSDEGTGTVLEGNGPRARGASGAACGGGAGAGETAGAPGLPVPTHLRLRVGP